MQLKLFPPPLDRGGHYHDQRGPPHMQHKIPLGPPASGYMMGTGPGHGQG